MLNSSRHFVRPFAMLALGLATINMAGIACAQLTNGAMIVPEFFEELYQIPASGGTAIDLRNSPMFQEVPGDNLAIADADTAYITYFADLYRFQFTTGQLSFVDELSFNPSEITVDTNGDLIGVAPGELFRINPVTGAETSLYDETFFNPSDAVVDADGKIFLTEFFDSIGVLNTSGAFTKIGNYSANKFGHLDLGPDGMLYLSTTVGSSFYRVDPASGAGVELDSNVFTFIRDLQVDAAGDIIFSGEVDAQQGVFRFDPATKSLTTIVDNTMANDGFFNPLDIAIFSSDESFAGADLNQDGDVDGDDLVSILNAYGVGSGGDTDGDGDTDGGDVLAWQRQFTGGAGLSAIKVPEPSTMVLLAIGAMTSLGRTGRSPDA